MALDIVLNEDIAHSFSLRVAAYVMTGKAKHKRQSALQQLYLINER